MRILQAIFQFGWPKGAVQDHHVALQLDWEPLKGGGIEVGLPADFYEDWKYPNADAKDKVARLRVA